MGYLRPVLLQYKRVRELQRNSHTHYFYEATVGAGLPIISTLRSLVETGDRIVKVEGVFRSVSREHILHASCFLNLMKNFGHLNLLLT